jgi:hypothetical protein
MPDWHHTLIATWAGHACLWHEAMPPQNDRICASAARPDSSADDEQNGYLRAQPDPAGSRTVTRSQAPGPLPVAALLPAERMGNPGHHGGNYGREGQAC